MNQEIQKSPDIGHIWAMFCHLAGFLGLIIPFGNIIGPLIIWSMKKKEYPFVNEQGKESLNFQITYLIYFIGFGLLAALGTLFFGLMLDFSTMFYIFLTLYVLLGIILVGTYIISMIIAAIKASNEESFSYPLTIRFIK